MPVRYCGLTTIRLKFSHKNTQLEVTVTSRDPGDLLKRGKPVSYSFGTFQCSLAEGESLASLCDEIVSDQLKGMSRKSTLGEDLPNWDLCQNSLERDDQGNPVIRKKSMIWEEWFPLFP